MQRGVPPLPLMRFGRNIRLARFCLVLVTCAAVSSSKKRVKKLNGIKEPEVICLVGVSSNLHCK